MIKRIILLALALQLFSAPAFAGGSGGETTGQTDVFHSVPTAQAAPNQSCASALQSGHAASAYGANQLINLNSTAASDVAMVYSTGLASGTPVHINGGLLKVATSSAFTTAAASTGGYFLLELYGTQPASFVNGDGGAYKGVNTNWCGALACTLSAAVPDGSDFSIANCTPAFGASVDCVPATTSIYGYLQTMMTTWSPSTTTYNYVSCVTFQ